MSINLIDPESSNIHTNRIFKRTLKNDIVNKWVEKNVNKWLRRRFENALIVPPGVNEDLPEWAKENMRQGKNVHRFILSNSSEDILKHINDLFSDLINYSNQPKSEISTYAEKVLGKISHYTVDELFDMANDFYEKMADITGPQAASRSRNEIFAVSRFDAEEVLIPAGEHGYAWRQVVPRGLKTVAVKLKNCLGGRHYAQGVRSGKEEIWVLVKPSEDGTVDNIDNICAAMQISLSDKRVVEVKGESNSAPIEYDKEISHFCGVKNITDPEVKKKYSGFSINRNMEDLYQKIKTRGEWEVWIENDISSTRTHLLGKKIVIKNINKDSSPVTIGMIEYIDKYITPDHKNKTHCLTIYPDMGNFIESRDSALLVNDIRELLLPKDEKDNVVYSTYYERPVTEFLRSPLNGFDFQVKNDSHFKDNYLVSVVSNPIVWHDRIIFEKNIGDLSVSLLDDGGIVLKAMNSLGNAESNEESIFNMIPPTPYTLSLAKNILNKFDQFPISFTSWKEALLFNPKEINITDDEMNTIYAFWHETVSKNRVQYSHINTLISQNDDKDTIFRGLLEFDKTGLLLSGNLETTQISKNQYEMAYYSSIFGAIPKDIIITPDGVINSAQLEFNRDEDTAIEYSQINYKTLLGEGATLNAIAVKRDDSYKNVISETFYVNRYPGSYNVDGGIDRFKKSRNLNVISVQNDSDMIRNSDFFQSLQFVKFLLKKTTDFDNFNTKKLTPQNLQTDIFPMPLIKEEGFFDKKRRNLGTEEFPIIKTSNPNRYFGIQPGKDGTLESGNVVWMASVNAEKEMKLYKVYKNGVEHLCNSLNIKAWNLSHNLQVETKDFFQKNGYTVYRGKLLKSSNTSLDNFQEGRFKIRRNFEASGVAMDPGDDRTWKIDIFKKDSWSQEKYQSVFTVTASNSKSANNKNIAYISNDIPYNVSSFDDADLNGVRNYIVKIVNESSMEISAYDALWLGVQKDSEGIYQLERDTHSLSIKLPSGIYVCSELSNRHSNFSFRGNPEDKHSSLGYMTKEGFSVKAGNEISVSLMESALEFRKYLEQYHNNVLENEDTLKI